MLVLLTTITAPTESTTTATGPSSTSTLSDSFARCRLRQLGSGNLYLSLFFALSILVPTVQIERCVRRLNLFASSRRYHGNHIVDTTLRESEDSDIPLLQQVERVWTEPACHDCVNSRVGNSFRGDNTSRSLGGVTGIRNCCTVSSFSIDDRELRTTSEVSVEFFTGIGSGVTNCDFHLFFLFSDLDRGGLGLLCHVHWFCGSIPSRIQGKRWGVLFRMVRSTCVGIQCKRNAEQ
jgi:hypothetical protein